MKLHRFFISENLARDRGTIRDKDIVHQLYSVLRKKAGDIITLCDRTGEAAHVIIRSITKNALEYEIIERLASPAVEKRNIFLYCAILKHAHLELVAEKTTELGIARLTPIITERTIKTGIKSERIKKIMQEAAEQSERIAIPELGSVMSFADALVEAKKLGKVFFADTGTAQKKAVTINPGVSASLFIGPEGGWTENEREIAKNSGATVLSLGPNILRAETAAIVGVYELRR